MLKSFKSSASVTLIAICLGWFLCAIDIVLLILFQQEIAQTLAIDVQKIRIGIGVGLLGSAMGGVWFAQLGDQIGRVKALSYAVLLYSIATGLMGFIDNINHLYLLRFLAGIGTGGEWSVGFALLTEVIGQKKRGLFGGIVAMMFNLGTLVAILLHQSSLGWRYSFALMATPALLSFVIRAFLPESQTWLALQDAKKTGGLSDALKEQTGKAPLKAILIQPWVKTTLITTLIFIVMNFAFYTFSTLFMNFLQGHEHGGLGLKKEDQFSFELLLNFSSLMSVVLAGVLSDMLGRRKAFALFVSLGVIGFSWLCVAIAPMIQDHQLAMDSYRSLMLPFVLCCAGFGVNGIMGIYTPELYPTHLRSTGPGFCQNVGKGIGGLSGPILGGVLLKSTSFMFVFGVIGAVLSVLLVLIWGLPEVGMRKIEALEEEVLHKI